MRPHEYWSETPADRKARVLRQESDRDSLVNDHMELVYSADINEIFAELLRLHAIVKDERTQELIDRVFADADRFARG
ncbi:hypothetical protein RB623_13285 [Mesorhizobium sp. LHD-90]|uniref:hypothetical protein n=1 Tax=Mesorhizobium sp. LHD-90 TaxID=3071414 RepID=UPI0027DFBF59|nr:hypothetical protein [Mesorhizobium sp. LHD-90]MDQ6435023.1 hypothetical protein [Mesorhizobium sp. LHD-90]